MGLKKIGKVLAGIAPIAASAVSGGLLGPVAAGVAKQVTGALGLPDDAPEEDIERAVVNADPTQLAKLRQINADLQRDLAQMDVHREELGIERERVHQRDRASARRREIAVRDSTPRVLVYGTIGLFAGLSVALLFIEVPEHSRMLLGGLVGILGGEVARQGAYYFGSSQGSQKKDATIEKALHGKDQLVARG